MRAMRKSRSLAVLLAFAILVPYENLLILFKPAFAQKRTEVTTETDWGLHTVTIDTLHGKVIVNLPDDMAEGDTISGTVIVEPKGKTQAEREKNLNDLLTGYVVKIGEKETRLTDVISPVLLAGLAGKALQVTLNDLHRKKKLASANVPVNPPRPTIVPPGRPGEPIPPGGTPPFTPPPTPLDYQLPKIGQAGRPFEVKGPCNGKFGDTRGRVGGKEAQLLAESPRKAVFRSPSDVTGSTEIEFTEGNVTTKGPFRNVAISLTAKKTKLLKGETTTLTIEASGLEGLQEELQLLLRNRTPGVVRVEGGDVQVITIRPEDVGPVGTYTVDHPMTAIGQGGFVVECQAKEKKDPCCELQKEIDQLEEEQAILQTAATELKECKGPKEQREAADKNEALANQHEAAEAKARGEGRKWDAENARIRKEHARKLAARQRRIAELQEEYLKKTEDEKGRTWKYKAADKLIEDANGKKNEREAKKKEHDKECPKKKKKGI